MAIIAQLSFGFDCESQKICGTCRLSKPLSEFSRHVKSKDGRAWECKICSTAKNSKWQKANPDKCRASSERYRNNNRERYKARLRKFYLEKGKAQSKDNYAKLKANSEKLQFERQRINKWRRDNPKRRLEEYHKRRARILNLPGSHTKEEFSDLCALYGGRCLCCGEKKKLTIDHVIPVSLPGSSNDIGNIQPLCHSCNCSKCDRHIDYRPQAEKWKVT